MFVFAIILRSGELTMMLNDEQNRCIVDSGAVPDTSTIYGGETGSTRIIKAYSCIRHGSAVIGLKKINANDNFAPVAMAA